MSKYWSQIVKTITPYVPGEQPKDKKYIKLNTNESPYPPSPRVIEAIKNAADDRLRLYPQPECDKLRETIAAYYQLNKQQVYIGNGSDELLAFAFMAFFEPGKPILYADITYSFYPVYSKLFNIDYQLIPLDEDFNIPVDRFLEKNYGVVLANPNAPTSKPLTLQDIQRILKQNTESVVIVDEAYIDFGGESAIPLIKEYPNLLVVQTLSKSRCLAGLRVGVVLGDENLIQAIQMVKNSFNSYTIDQLALAGAVEAFADDAYFKDTVAKIVKTRENVAVQLKQKGFLVPESKANFLFISHPKVSADIIFKELRDRGILVRYFKQPRIDNYLRVTIGTDEEMDCFLKAIDEITVSR